VGSNASVADFIDRTDYLLTILSSVQYRLGNSETGMGKDIITIVSGLPRSGTSMMMSMLEASGIPALVDNVRKADQDNPKGYYEFEPVKKTKQNHTWLEDAQGKVVKMVHLLLKDLPLDRQYRVIFMKRNLEEIIASQDIMLERRGRKRNDLTQEQLMKGFNAQIQEIGDYLKDKPNFKILYADYNEILKDPLPWVQNINQFLGGSLDTDNMLKVVEPALYRQRR
jgi:hypothetical protein